MNLDTSINMQSCLRQHYSISKCLCSDRHSAKLWEACHVTVHALGNASADLRVGSKSSRLKQATINSHCLPDMASKAMQRRLLEPGTLFNGHLSRLIDAMNAHAIYSPRQLFQQCVPLLQIRISRHLISLAPILFYSQQDEERARCQTQSTFGQIPSSPRLHDEEDEEGEGS
jgi:hypothetical protein